MAVLACPPALGVTSMRVGALCNTAGAEGGSKDAPAPERHRRCPGFAAPGGLRRPGGQPWRERRGPPALELPHAARCSASFCPLPLLQWGQWSKAIESVA